MSEDRYTKHYVKILNNTLTETVLRNVQMQAQAEFVDELVGELHNENESLKQQVQELSEHLQEKINIINGLNETKFETDKVKHKLQHLETFREELIEEREAHAKALKKIEELENKISELQSPAKSKVKKTSIATQIPVEEEPVKDGGTF